MAGHPAPGLGEMLRTIAVARLILQDMNIQAPPNLAPADYRLYLWAGINDWGGISPLTPDFINPEAPWPKLAELKATCRAEGFELRERLAIYPEYIRPEFVPAGLWPKVAALTDEEGLVRPELEGPY
jgi:FO synthase